MGNQQIDDISDSQTFEKANKNVTEDTTSHLLQTPEILLKYSMPTKETKYLTNSYIPYCSRV